jgi:hypothetical protein
MRVPCGSFTGDVASLAAVFAGNVRGVTIQVPIGDKLVTRCSHIFGVKGSWALINRHFLPYHKETIELGLLVAADSKSDEPYRRVSIFMGHTVSVSDDVLLCQISGERFKDITQHMVSSVSPPKVFKGWISGRSVSVHTGHITLTSKEEGHPSFIVKNPYIYPFPEHEAGMCGLPLFAQLGKGSAILGIHCAGGSEGEAYAARVHLEDLQRALNIGKERSVFVESASLDHSVKYVDPAWKSLVHFEKLRGMTYWGYTGDPIMINGRSRLKRTLLVGSLDEFFLNHFAYISDQRFLRPLMKPKVVHGVYLNPFNIAARKLGRVTLPLDKKICEKVITDIQERFFAVLDAEGVELSPLDVRTAVNGAREDAYLRRINASTSAGLGYTGAKSKYLPLVDEAEGWYREPVPDLMEDVVARIEAYFTDSSPGFVFQATLKDEPRVLEKVRSGKTRVFYAMSVSDLVVSRMVLAPLYTLMVQFSEVFCTAVGINMHVGADELYKRLGEFSPLIIEGDYSCYDQGMPAEVTLMANTILFNIAKRYGYSPAALVLLRGVLSDTAMPFLNILGDVFSKYGSQPSGKYGTAEDNSLRGLILLCYAFNLLCPEEKFFECVLPVTYGDDVVGSVKEKVAEKFNNITYQRVVERVFGMGFTSATKSAEMEKFLSLDEASFLKRHFVHSVLFDRIVAPLELSSLYKALEWTIPSTHTSREDQVLSTVRSVLWELAFHCTTQAQFNRARSDLVALVVEKYDLSKTYVEEEMPVVDDVITAVCDSG